MKINIDLAPEAFGTQRQELFRNADFAVSAQRCTARGPTLTLANRRGALTVLPYQGLAIWDAEFDGYSLKSGRRSVRGGGRKRDDTAAFCPAWPHQDGAPLQMQRVWLQLAGDELTLRGEGERPGACWRIGPALRLAAQSAQFTIEMQVTNLADRPQPLQYVCRLNYDCIPMRCSARICRRRLCWAMRSGGSCCAPTICRATWIRPSSSCWRRKAGAM